AGFGSFGLPALAGFIAEITVFVGAFEKYEWAVLASIFGVVLSAGYVLWMLQRVMFGPVKHEWDGVTDQHHWWEHSVVIGLAALVVLLGVYPLIMTDMIGPAVDSIALRINSCTHSTSSALSSPSSSPPPPSCWWIRSSP